ncbi:MAG: ISAs1 family transposase [Gemmataceae bacterium]
MPSRRFSTVSAAGNGIPDPDTFSRVFAKLDPDRLRRCLRPVDGGRLWEHRPGAGGHRWQVGSRAPKRQPPPAALHLVSALGHDQPPDAKAEWPFRKSSNEIAVIPELLRMLDLNGAIVTLDAAGCQVERAASSVEQGGDYLLAVKGDQPGLQEAVHGVFRPRWRRTLKGWRTTPTRRRRRGARAAGGAVRDRALRP